MKMRMGVSMTLLLVLAGALPLAAQSGCTWSGVSLGSGAQVFSLKAWNDGSGPALFAGTRFQQPGMQIAHGVKWDGSTWTTMGPGLNGPPTCMVVFDDGTGPALYVGGAFAFLGGIPLWSSPYTGTPITSVARWDGTAWSSVGSPLMSPPPSSPLAGVLGVAAGTAAVSALTVFDDGSGPALYAQGGFVSSGGVSLPGLAKWDGVAWAPPPTGMTAQTTNFRILGAHDLGAGPELYAWFPDLPGGLRRWDGSAWQPLGSGMTGLAGTAYPPNPAFGIGPGLFPPLPPIVPLVTSLAVFDDGTGAALYAGGAFDFAGGVPANGIARWDGSSWSALGGGLGFGQNSPSHVDIIRCLAVHDDGTGPALIAAGDFSQAANHIMKWDGVSWSTMNGGLNGVIVSLETYDDGAGPALFAGPSSFVIGGYPNTGTALGINGNLAKWTCPTGPVLTLFQAESSGITGSTGVFVGNTQLVPGREYYNIFSLDLCPQGVGNGPYAGLCFGAGSLQFLLDQLLLPVGTLPSHFIAAGSMSQSGPYSLPPLTIEGVCFEVNASGIGPTSPAVRYTVQ